MKKIKFLVSYILVLTVLIGIGANLVFAVDPGDVVINEIGWKTDASAGDEWIEFYNTTDEDINLEGWIIRRERDGKEVTFSDDAGDAGINLNNSTIPANGYFLIERINAAGDSSSISTIVGDFQSKDLYNFLQAAGENLTLKDSAGNIIDNVDCSDGWFAGDNDNSMSMEKIMPDEGSNDERWWGTYDPLRTAPYALDANGNDIYGTPGQQNSIYDTFSPPAMPSDILGVSNSPFFPHEDHTPAVARIAYRNPKDSSMYATVTIYDIEGYAVKHILRYKELESREWEYYEWNGEDEFGDILPMGVYIVHLRLESGDASGVEEGQAVAVIGRKF